MAPLWAVPAECPRAAGRSAQGLSGFLCEKGMDSGARVKTLPFSRFKKKTFSRFLFATYQSISNSHLDFCCYLEVCA